MHPHLPICTPPTSWCNLSTSIHTYQHTPIHTQPHLAPSQTHLHQHPGTPSYICSHHSCPVKPIHLHSSIAIHTYHTHPHSHSSTHAPTTTHKSHWTTYTCPHLSKSTNPNLPHLCNNPWHTLIQSLKTTLTYLYLSTTSKYHLY